MNFLNLDTQLANLRQRLHHARDGHREYRRAHAELDHYSEREITADLGISRSDIAEMAAATADQRVGRHVAHPTGGRPAWHAPQQRHGYAHG